MIELGYVCLLYRLLYLALALVLLFQIEIITTNVSMVCKISISRGNLVGRML